MQRSLFLSRQHYGDDAEGHVSGYQRLTKGEVWLNGRALGRFWNIGPQKTLYIPAPWLKPGKNEVVVFDLDGKPDRKIEGLGPPDPARSRGGEAGKLIFMKMK